MKVAIVYDRVNKWGGAERVLLSLHKLFPDAPLYTSVYNPKTAKWASIFPNVIPSFLNNFPLAKTRHDLYAPLMPIAFESFDFTGFDLVISVTSEAAKGIITKPETLHICYCLTPTRYLWSGYEEYLVGIRKILSAPLINYLRKWDKVAAQRPDVTVGISRTVSNRIKRYYNRQSSVIYPPVETSHFVPTIHSSPITRHYLVVSRLVPYKKIDLVINVFNRLQSERVQKPLVIVGTGSEEWKLKRIAKSNISFTGQISDTELARYYLNARALIFPQEEDFGIVAVEAQAAGIPVIAYKKGGASETVSQNSGLFFEKQNIESLTQAIDKFESMEFKVEDCKKNALKFSEEKFAKNFAKLVSSLT